MESHPVIYLFTDGAASGNPGPGGYGIVLKTSTPEGAPIRKELSGGFALTTNNRMELLAVILGLEAIRWKNALVEVWSDSKYVVDAVEQGWLTSWIANGWTRGKKHERVENVDLWQRFNAVYKTHRVSFHWLHGHRGHPENERCDTLAVAAYHNANLPADTGYLNVKQSTQDIWQTIENS